MTWINHVRARLPVRRQTYEAERAARLAAEAAGERLALFADATKALTSSFDLNVVLRDLAHLVAPAFADACLIDLVESDGSIRRAATAITPGCEEWASGLAALRPPGAVPDDPVEEVLRSGAPQVVEESDCSAVVVPLKGRQGALGVLWLVRAGSPAGTSTVQLAEELARRASIAVDNARLFARQRTVSETLQQSLLPERLPDIPGLATAARYVPGGPDVDIGGDWYDVMQLPGAGIGLALGDVVGRGERAASLMGQLRNAVRAYAFEGRSPGEVMEQVNGLLLDAGSEHMATMVYGVLDAESGEFRFVNAGHPPPLLVSSTREARFLSGGNGPPVGSLPTARYAEGSVLIEPGTTLLLYTDGLVEDRATPLEEGLQRLLSAADDGPAELEAFCSHLMRRAVGVTPCDDDVALLAVQLMELEDRLHLEVPAQPGALAPLRATLRRWLLRAGATETETYEVLTACGEAATNAIRHASGPLHSDFEVDANIVEGSVEIRVRDRGKWRERRTNVGGRGLPIIEAYVDEFEITPSPSGTEVRMRRRLSHDGELVG
jgi:serine phosphatase RsbU (regulator of sigma subunit)/anti-sigma regulatory factor (Ser/Thr protein kinase)